MPFFWCSRAPAIPSETRQLVRPLEDAEQHGPREFAGVRILQRGMIAGEGNQSARAACIRPRARRRSPCVLANGPGATRAPAGHRTRCGRGTPPRADSVSSFISRSSHGAQLRISSGVGLLPGGAQRATEVIQRPLSFMPSSREEAAGCEANPAACRTGNRKSPEPSPVKGLPVRFEPCAPGASPSASTRALVSPKEGTGRPQYSQSA